MIVGFKDITYIGAKLVSVWEHYKVVLGHVYLFPGRFKKFYQSLGRVCDEVLSIPDLPGILPQKSPLFG